MSVPAERRPARTHWARTLLLVPFVAVMWVPWFNRVTPLFLGLPFFYWYQLAWILISGVLIAVVYLIEHRD